MKCFRMKTAAKMEGDTSVLITATNYMRFSGQIAGEKLQLSSQNICACFHAAAVPALFVYLFALRLMTRASVTQRGAHRRSWAVCGNLLCASLPTSSADPTSRFQRPTWPWGCLGAAGPACAGLGWAERCCCVPCDGWAAPLARCSTRAVCWSEVKAVIHEAIVLFLSTFSFTLMSLAWSAQIAPSLTIRGAQSIHPHFLPDLSVFDGRDSRHQAFTQSQSTLCQLWWAPPHFPRPHN